jgi:hypothetical protein
MCQYFLVVTCLWLPAFLRLGRFLKVTSRRHVPRLLSGCTARVYFDFFVSVFLGRFFALGCSMFSCCSNLHYLGLPLSLFLFWHTPLLSFEYTYSLSIPIGLFAVVCPYK